MAWYFTSLDNHEVIVIPSRRGTEGAEAVPRNPPD